ncbi:hypothetical protein K227x_59160 [Rubripirellula lacrimiformis]|uniref:VWFA domain-containing protein n=1 Tax=Rubripirellula lacrimiformis TaxID=1930273 RepID=A0A517NK87_9BACT|nr:hypothetical protein [Rubripirellula lacrimiformis]QDT07489.1 hypothetical protein K227x_59160 [Rubripirellula lacrimiformis]
MFQISRFVAIALMLGVTPAIVGCVKSQSIKQEAPFEVQELDACLAIVIDMSGSFSQSWDDRAYGLFLDLSERFFTEGMGTDTRLVISQLSGSERVVLFEGEPSELRTRFAGPDELNRFLRDHSEPSQSRVYESTKATLDYIGSLGGVTDQTRLLTVILSDMQDSEQDLDVRRQMGNEMIESLKRYQAAGGGLALYFVSADETTRWKRILSDAGFEPGHYVIENELTQSPQLPRFE